MRVSRLRMAARTSRPELTLMRVAFAVINQMDTSQAHLSSKAGATKENSKPSDLSKDELHAVLKYGAQKM